MFQGRSKNAEFLLFEKKKIIKRKILSFAQTRQSLNFSVIIFFHVC